MGKRLNGGYYTARDKGGAVGSVRGRSQLELWGLVAGREGWVKVLLGLRAVGWTTAWGLFPQKGIHVCKEYLGEILVLWPPEKFQGTRCSLNRLDFLSFSSPFLFI